MPAGGVRGDFGGGLSLPGSKTGYCLSVPYTSVTSAPLLSPHPTATHLSPPPPPAPATLHPLPAITMVRLPKCVAIGQPWIEPVRGYVIDDATEVHTHAPTSTAHPVVVNPVLMRRQRSTLVLLAPDHYLVRVLSVYKEAGGTVRIEVKVDVNEDAQRANFLVLSPLHPGVPLSENAMHFESNVIVNHPSGVIVYEMLMEYGQLSAAKLFNRLKRETSRMSAGPANGPMVGAGDYDEAMSIGQGFSLLSDATPPSITAGRLAFWPRLFWDDTFSQLMATVCSSAAIAGFGPVDLVDYGPVDAKETEVTTVSGAASGAGAGQGSGVGARTGDRTGSDALAGGAKRTAFIAGLDADAGSIVRVAAGPAKGGVEVEDGEEAVCGTEDGAPADDNA